MCSYYCSGLWSLIAVAAFVHEDLPQNLCYLHATFEGLCYCNLRLPYLVRISEVYTYSWTHLLQLCIEWGRETYCSSDWCTSNFSSWNCY